MPYAIIMIYINITSFVLISQLEKDHSMIEMRHLKNAIFFQTILSFHLITAHLVSNFSFSSIIFIVSYSNHWHFYCLNYTSLLLDLIITNLVNTFYNNYVINICPRQLL